MLCVPLDWQYAELPSSASDAVLCSVLVDAENAFNSMNRKAALHNVQRICPVISMYLINMYRTPCKLFVANRKTFPVNFIWSSEGATQGDNSASAFYSIGILPILFHLNDNCTCPQIWFADDAGAGGNLIDLKNGGMKLHPLVHHMGTSQNPPNHG